MVEPSILLVAPRIYGNLFLGGEGLEDFNDENLEFIQGDKTVFIGVEGFQGFLDVGFSWWVDLGLSRNLGEEGSEFFLVDFSGLVSVNFVESGLDDLVNLGFVFKEFTNLSHLILL